MRILIVLGAGASLDCWPGIKDLEDTERLPLANKLFASQRTQNLFLNNYDLMGLASVLRRRSRIEGMNFNIEQELNAIATRAQTKGDLNNLQNLFKARFYLHSVINNLTKITLNSTSSHTTYVDLLTELKEWIDDAPRERFVDIVTFNYDDLLEKAMENVYPYDWPEKSQSPLSAYYSGKNLRIYKPHGSINWGRGVTGADDPFSYHEVRDAFKWFNKIYLSEDFEAVDPEDFYKTGEEKAYIPAIAVPMLDKTDFSECPKPMFKKMFEAVKSAEVLVTIGWKGADNHFVKMLKDENDKINKVHVVSPEGTSDLSTVYPAERLAFHNYGFRQFVSDSVRFNELLTELV